MIALLYGKNSFLINQHVEQIISEFLSSGGAKDEITKVHVESETHPEDVLLTMQNVSLFADKKLTIVYDFTTNNEFTEKIEQFCDAADENNWLVFVDSTLQARSKVIKQVQGMSGAKVMKAEQMRSNDLASWASTYASTCPPGVTLGNREAMHLVERVGEDQLLLAKEIEKLASGLQKGDRVSTDYIDELVELTPQGSVFAMLDAMLASRPDKAMALFEEQKAQGAVSQQIMGMIVWQLTQLAIVVDSYKLSNKELTDKYGVSSFAVSKLRPIAQMLTNKDIAIIVEEVIDADMLSRTNASADDAIEYIVSFVSTYLEDKKTAAHSAAG